MRTIELNGITLVVTEKTARQIEAELQEVQAERRADWTLFHWYGRRWAMYGNKYGDGNMFSDLYKDLNGFRPTLDRDEIFWILYGRENWIEHR